MLVWYISNADRYFSGSEGITPLIWAANRGCLDITKQLIAAGSVIDHQDNDGESALYSAAKENRVKVVEYLLSQGADYRQRTTCARKPSDFAVVTDCLLRIQENKTAKTAGGEGEKVALETEKENEAAAGRGGAEKKKGVDGEHGREKVRHAKGEKAKGKEKEKEKERIPAQLIAEDESEEVGDSVEGTKVDEEVGEEERVEVVKQPKKVKRKNKNKKTVVAAAEGEGQADASEETGTIDEV
jgi:hypothetical protein